MNAIQKDRIRVPSHPCGTLIREVRCRLRTGCFYVCAHAPMSYLLQDSARRFISSLRRYGRSGELSPFFEQECWSIAESFHSITLSPVSVAALGLVSESRGPESSIPKIHPRKGRQGGRTLNRPAPLNFWLICGRVSKGRERTRKGTMTGSS